MKKLLFMFSIISLSFVGKTQKLPLKEDSLKKQVWNYIKCSNVKYPDLVFAQSLLESGNMTSKVFQNCHNLFGMKYPNKRKTVAVSKLKNGYAVYNCWYESIDDYALFQSYILGNKDLTRSQYLRMLDTRYCESKGYSQKLKRVISQNIKIINDTTKDTNNIL